VLDQLRQFLESPEHDDDPFVRLDSFELHGHDATLNLRVMNYDADQTWGIWEVRALGLRDFLVREPHGDLTAHSDHVLARQHTDRCVDLSFRGSPQSPAELVGQLYLTHHRLVADWIPFDRYLNNQVDLEPLLGGGYGKLADGPEFLVAAYAAIIERHGVSPSLLPARPAKWFDGRAWVETEAHLNTLVLGESFFVAVDYAERRA
jgi:hypothetical protein